MRLPERLPTEAHPTVKLTRREFDGLLEYSATLPTGKTIGKRWKRDLNAYRQRYVSHLHAFDGSAVAAPLGSDWWLGEYAPDPHARTGPDGQPETILIVWSKIELTD